MKLDNLSFAKKQTTQVVSNSFNDDLEVENFKYADQVKCEIWNGLDRHPTVILIQMSLSLMEKKLKIKKSSIGKRDT